MSEHPSQYEWQRFREGMDILQFYIPRDKQHIYAPQEEVISVGYVRDQIAEVQAHDKLQLELLGFYTSRGTWLYQSC